MADNLKFDLAGYYKWRCHQDQNRTLNFSPFNGTVSLTIWDSQKRGAPVDSIPLSRGLAELIDKMLTEILSAQPNTSTTVESKQWVRDPSGKGGKWEMRALFRFTKDEKQMYSIDITTSKMSDPFKKVFRSQPFAINTDDLTEEQRSALEVKEFLRFLRTEVPQMRIDSTFNMTRPQYGTGTGTSAPKIPPSTTPKYSDDDNVY